TRTPGAITLRARSKGLRSDSVTVRSVALKTEHGYATVLPVMPTVALPKQRPVSRQPELIAAQSTNRRPTQSGRFIKEFSYSGPAPGVRVETAAADGKKVYSDRATVFASLPADLAGADYVQGADADRLYSAVDLMEIAVKAGAVVSVAHDDRLPRPEWLTRQFKPLETSVTVDGQAMKVFQHRADRDESLTLGANTEDTNAKTGNM